MDVVVQHSAKATLHENGANVVIERVCVASVVDVNVEIGVVVVEIVVVALPVVDVTVVAVARGAETVTRVALIPQQLQAEE